MPVMVIAPKVPHYDKVVTNVEEIKARKGELVTVVTEGDDMISKLSKYVIIIPETIEFLTPILSVIPLQILSYHIANLRGCDVDQPRNLGKSVTVE